MVRTVISRMARIPLLMLLLLPVYGVDCEPCAVEFEVCDLDVGGTGWCMDRACVPNSCAGVNCNDDNDCTVDSCDPTDGSCLNEERDDFFASCDPTGPDTSGVCLGTECKSTQDDPCLRAGSGRINCCSSACCTTGVGFPATCGPDWATLCSTPLPDGTDCDPTGLEAPEASPNQAGSCVGGECIYDSGPCQGTTCEDGFDCTRDWCNPATGTCEGRTVDSFARCNGIDGACVGGITCLGQNSCVVPNGGYQHCCPPPDCIGNADGCSSDLFRGWYCDPFGGAWSETDASLGGRCIATQNGTFFDTECIPELCAIAVDPNDPNAFVARDCDDGNECSEDACDPATGQCTHTALPDYTSCNNGTGICISFSIVTPSWCFATP